MKHICYYREFEDDETLPSIKDNIFSVPISNKQKILQYLKSFEPHAIAPAVSKEDIFTNKKMAKTLSSYTDGNYIWLSDEVYYFERYNLKLDNDFIEFIKNVDILQNLKNKLKSKYNKE